MSELRDQFVRFGRTMENVPRPLAMKAAGVVLVIALSLMIGRMGLAHGSVPDDFRLHHSYLTIETDKANYFLNENVIISGNVESAIFEANEPVILRVYSPVEEIFNVKVFPDSNGNYSYVLRLDPALLTIPSGYDIYATYTETKAVTTFYLVPQQQLMPGQLVGSEYYVDINHTRYQINYSLNGIIQNITVDAKANSLIVDALVYTNASFLDISFDPGLIRATKLDEAGQERNVNFTVLVNGKNADKVRNSIENQTFEPDYGRRVFVSKLVEGQNRVEIIGTRVAPEFSPAGLAVITISVAAAIISTKVYSKGKRQ